LRPCTRWRIAGFDTPSGESGIATGSTQDLLRIKGEVEGVCGVEWNFFRRKKITGTIILSDPLCQQLAEDIALLTYRSTRPTALKTASQALRSSLWIYRDHRWQMLFHQGTPI